MYSREALEVAARADFEACLDDIRRGSDEDVTITWENISEDLRQVWREQVHRPRRGDAIERWLIAQREQHDLEQWAWHALDAALEEYRLRADNALLLHEEM